MAESISPSLFAVDREVSKDMATVFTWLAREDAVYPIDYRAEIDAIIASWRPEPA
ncbi:hypothetical protein [Sinorhizobium meliloti]|uniref:DUF7673 family protein n=1 Tax=Rhizobium meliloti TaxID=382 RepID=UPI00299E639A|nr:hypothetical protein [Sinorhizobium meliloti]